MFASCSQFYGSLFVGCCFSLFVVRCVLCVGLRASLLVVCGWCGVWLLLFVVVSCVSLIVDAVPCWLLLLFVVDCLLLVVVRCLLSIVGRCLSCVLFVVRFVLCSLFVVVGVLSLVVVRALFVVCSFLLL